MLTILYPKVFCDHIYLSTKNTLGNKIVNMKMLVFMKLHFNV